MKFDLKYVVAGVVGAASVLSAPVFAQTASASLSASSASATTSVAEAEIWAVATPVRAAILQHSATASTLQLQNAIVAAIPANSDPAAVGFALNTLASEFAGSATVTSALAGAAVQSEMVTLPVLGTVPAGAVVVGGLVILGGVVIGVVALDDDSDY